MSNRMKKAAAAVLALLMLWSLTACSQVQTSPEVQRITMATIPSGEAVPSAPVTQPPETATGSSGTVEDGFFAFTYEDVELQPGQAFDPSVLPAPTYTYTVPSCALEGTDNVYNYGTFEITAFDAGEGEFIYSVYFVDPNLATAEGLALGDPLDKAESLYGRNYAREGTACTYTRTDTQLVLILQENSIVSIEYRLVTE